MSTNSRIKLMQDQAWRVKKACGHPQLELLHVASALASRSREKFAEAFGPSAVTQVEAALRRLTFPAGAAGVSPEAQAFFDGLERFHDPWEASYKELRPYLENVFAGRIPTPPTEPDISSPPSPGPPPPESTLAPSEPSVPSSESGSDRLVSAVTPARDVECREDVVAQVLNRLSLHAPQTPCITGVPGCGRTALLSALAHRLTGVASPSSLAEAVVMRISAEAVLAEAEPASAFRHLIAGLDRSAVIVVDDLEVLASLGGPSVDGPMLSAVRSLVDGDQRVVVTLAEPYWHRLEQSHPELAEELNRVRLEPLAGDCLLRTGRRHATLLGEWHDVTVDDEIVAAAARPPSPGDRRAHPGLMIDRLDAACRRAAERGSGVVTADDLPSFTAPSLGSTSVDSDGLRAGLRQRVSGQGPMIDAIVPRISLTRLEGDVAPERPDGAFLFVGAPGTGRATTAKALAELLAGSPDALLRLHMLDYRDGAAVTRLTGTGSTIVAHQSAPGWLTSQLRSTGPSVLLLESVDKANQGVQDLLARAIDTGSITDAAGASVSIARTIIIMTIDVEPGSDGTEALDRSLNPGLTRMVDAVVHFVPLDEAALVEIAERESERAVSILNGLGYSTTIGPGVARVLATLDADPALGAAHIPRNLDRLIQEPRMALGRAPHEVSLDALGMIVIVATG